MLLVKNENLKTYESDIRALLNSFYPGEEIRYESDDAESVAPQGSEALDIVIDIDAIAAGIVRSEDRFDDKTSLKLALYQVLSERTGKELPWGTLTGIRPVRIVEKYEAAGGEARDPEEMRELLKTKFSISDEKISLMTGIYDLEKQLLAETDYKNGYSIYIGIPFCPTRCVYCSFTAYPFAQWESRAYEYIDAVGRELQQLTELSGTSRGMESALAGKELQTIYVGGGTPSVLTPDMIDHLMNVIEQYVDVRKLREFTYEAGRPDTITREKLEVLRKHGVTRISINPQTMQQKTLDLIGRKHTVEQIGEAYQMARELGFDNINMDMITGLPGEDIADVSDTLSKIAVLDPDSLTVHALAVKRASRLNVEGNAWGGMQRKGLDREGINEASRMTALGALYAKEHAMKPYYLYRQKNMAGNQENVGYAKEGKENLYNILMMEELHTVIGVGAGSSTKVVLYDEDGKQVKRFENMKNVEEYLSRTEELLGKRERFLQECLLKADT